MGAFKNLFRSKDNSAKDPPYPPPPHAQPLWALATEPNHHDPVIRWNGFGPREPSSKSIKTARPLSNIETGRPPSRSSSTEASLPMKGNRTTSLDDVLYRLREREIQRDRVPPSLISSSFYPHSLPQQSRRGPLPTPPTNDGLHRPKSHQRAYSSPPAPLPPVRTYSSPPNFSPGSFSPTKILKPFPPVRMNRAALSSSGISITSSNSFNSANSGVTSSSVTSTSSYAPSTSSLPYLGPPSPYLSDSLYPQALPTPPRPFPAPIPIPIPIPIVSTSDRTLYRQAVPSSPTLSIAASSVYFPGAFPKESPEQVEKVNMPEQKNWNAWDPAGDNSAFWGLNISDVGSVPSYPKPSPPLPPNLTRPPLSPSFPSSASYQSQQSERPRTRQQPHKSHHHPIRTPPASAKRPSKTPPAPVIDLSNSSSDDDTTTPPCGIVTLAKNQCSGTTGSGKRCTRIVDAGSSPARKNSPVPPPGALDLLDDMLADDDEGKAVPRFCFQHSKQALSERGCFITRIDGRGGKGEWIEFEDWILPDLPTATKILLRLEMARPVSDKDEEGFIYCHEMVEKRLPTSHSHTVPRTTFLKLGRSIKPVSRLSQWRSQCPSREPVVRDIFPRASGASSGSRVSGALRIAEKGVPNHHRWERLMLIEVAGRAGMEADGRGKSSGKPTNFCGDCGKKHVELFEVYEGAWEDWVREVVERWMRWCEMLG